MHMILWKTYAELIWESLDQENGHWLMLLWPWALDWCIKNKVKVGWELYIFLTNSSIIDHQFHIKKLNHVRCRNFQLSYVPGHKIGGACTQPINGFIIIKSWSLVIEKANEAILLTFIYSIATTTLVVTVFLLIPGYFGLVG